MTDTQIDESTDGKMDRWTDGQTGRNGGELQEGQKADLKSNEKEGFRYAVMHQIMVSSRNL